MNPRTVSVGILLMQDSNVLLVKHTGKAKHKTGVYGFPAGRVEKGETLVQAAARELEEETGLIAEEKDLIEFSGNYFEAEIVMKYGPERFAFTVFLCRKFAGDLNSSPENLPEWISIADLDSFETLPNIKDAIESARRFLNG